MKWVGRPTALFIYSMLLWGSGCATSPRVILPKPVQSPHRGFLDRIGLRESSSLVSLNRKFKLLWPLHSTQVTSPFGMRGGEFHEGVDLRAHIGTPVYAAQKGIVLYADQKIRGYGKMVVIRHDNEIATIYAHNSKILVRRGQRVRQGQQISISGNTGHSHGPHLHFEIRRGLAALNPIQFLPAVLAKTPVRRTSRRPKNHAIASR